MILDQTIAEIDARQATEDAAHTTAKPLTARQKLERALKICRKDRKKSERLACERQARKRYPAKKKKG